ncbi:sulfotransferase family 2 domain-containing protein [Gallaecimonas mangrovi]|uniref:sulfotransferase family 2 domain-containing protein n=1 Tax=Gallaecimonas mangrovi TaxID=2291597 RepID=UPI000E2006B7|nr:sulfotransferase family 2 domain-containing protein [Gallaecimonas mangrovi]
MGLRTKVRKIFWKLDDRNKKRNGYDVVHYLHIGKSGGSAFKYAIRGENKKNKRVIFQNVIFYIHGHNVPMMQVPKGEKVIFFLRDPIKRFISSFYERLRQGQPRVFFPWSTGEKEAYQHFKTANELASALSSEDAIQRQQAEDAMAAIDHIRSPQISWVESLEYLRSRRDDVYFIGAQETLNDDFQLLKAKARLPDSVQLPDRNNIVSNTMPDEFDKTLSAQAEQNLRNWYAKDYELIAVVAEEFADKKQH